MAIPKVMLPLDGTLEGQDRDGPVTAAQTGAVRWVDGPYTERQTVSPLLVASPDNTEDRRGPLAPYLSSSVTLGEGRYGKTWKLKKANTPQPSLKLSPIEGHRQSGEITEIYEETINLIRNPKFVNLRGVGYTSSHRIAVEDGVLELEAVHATNTLYWLQESFPNTVKEGDIITISMTVWASRDGIPYGIPDRPLDEKGVVISWTQSPRFQTTTQPTRVTWTRKAMPAGTNAVQVGIAINGNDHEPGDVLWVTKPQVEIKPYATAYCDGDMGEGHAWTGEPNYSASMRVRGSALKGAVRSKQGPDGQPVWVFEEGTTNLIRNPRGAIDTYGWNVSSGVSMTAGHELPAPFPDHPLAPKDVTTCFRSTITATTAVTTASTIADTYVDLPQTGTYAGYIWVYIPSTWTGQSFWARHSNYVGGGIIDAGSRPDMAKRDQWQLLRWGGEFGDDLTGNWRLAAQSTGHWNEGEYIYFTAAQLENKPYATTYCDGSMGAGYAWTGTPHASSSVRQKGTVEIPFSNQVTEKSGAVFAWITFPPEAEGAYPISIGGTQGFLMGMHSSGYVNSYLGPSINNLGNGQITIPRNEPVMLGLEWNESEAWISFNGEVVNNRGRGGNTSVAFGSTILIGYFGTTEPRPSVVHNVVIFPRRLSGAERRFLFNNPSWSWSDLDQPDGEVVIGHEPTTNLIPNPSFETGTSPWITLNGATVTRDTEYAVAGNASLRVETSGTTARQGTYTLNNRIQLPEGTTSVTMSAYVRGEGRIEVGFDEYNGGSFVKGNYVDEVVVTPQWQRVVGTVFTLQPNTTHVLPFIRTTRTAQAVTFWVDAIQLETKTRVTSYTDGDMDDVEWNGEPHNSSSTRTHIRGEAVFTKNALIRYSENGEYKTVRVEGRTGKIGEYGRYTTLDGTLRIAPNSESTVEVENILLYEHDMASVEDVLTGIADTWTIANATIPMDVPIKVPFLEEATTNYVITNPLSAPNTTGTWADWGGSGHFRPYYVRPHCYEIPAGTANGTIVFAQWLNGGQRSMSGFDGQPLTFSVKVRGEGMPEGSKVYLSIRFSDTDNRQLSVVNGPSVDITGEEQYITLTAESIPQTTTGVIVYVRCLTGGTRFEQDAVFEMYEPQAELKAYATTFCPQVDEFGNLREGYSWTGEVNRSASERRISSLRYGIPDPTKGAYAVRFRLGQSYGSNAYVFSSGATSTTFLSLSAHPSHLIRPTVYVDGKQVWFGDWSQKLSPDEIYTVVYEWEGDQLRLYISDGQVLTYTIPENRRPTSTEFRLGAYGSSFSSNSTLYGAAMFDRPLTPAERDTLMNTAIWEWDTLFPTPERVNRQAAPSPIGILRRQGEG